MKHFLLLIAALSASAAVAQVQVDSLNRLVLGNKYPYWEANPGGITKSQPDMWDPDDLTETKLDSLAQMCVLGKGKYRSGGRISFGDLSNVYVGELSEPANNLMPTFRNVLQLNGNGGITLSSGNGIVARYTNSTGLFRFNTDVTVDGVFVHSDSRLKSNVSPLSERTALLSGIEAVSYNLSRGETAMKTAATEGVETEMTNPADNRERFGFIAQQVKEYFPELVKEDEDGYLSVDYIGFIPVLVDAVNALSQKVEDQQAIIDSMTTQRKQKSAGVQNELDLEPSLAQNRPNPFSASTVIEFTLPQTVADASIFIYDMQGKQLIKIPVNERGRSSVNVDGRQLGAGMFIYALIADGEEIASRRMIITQ